MAELTLQEMWAALGDCWTQEFGELEIVVRHTLTEPTCPTAVVGTELEDKGPSWRADQDTIDEAIFAATKAAYMTIIERKPKPLTFPAPDIDEDSKVAKLLSAIDKRPAPTRSEGCFNIRAPGYRSIRRGRNVRGSATNRIANRS